MSEKLVLWKPRPQRITEAIVLPFVLFPVGPAMRALLGEHYSVLLGLAVTFPLLLLISFLGRRWALSHGGEWVTQADRLRRLLTEVGPSHRWWNALTNAIMYALIMTAMLLIIYPIGSIGEGLGGPAIAFGVVAAASVSAAIPALASRPKQLEKMIIEDGEPPPNHVRSEMWKNLLRIYLAYMLGSAAGIIVGLQLGKELRMAGFIVVALMTVQILRQLLLKVPKRVYPAAANSGFRSQMVSGILSWGIPVAILAGGFSIMLAWGRPEAVAVGVGTALLFAVPGGAFFGGWIYLIRRVTTRRSASST